ncbi:MAG: hypothetical protein M0Z67_04270 [Nitrospiraceae bacterium]|nr:hypothetical protein [Nitrospiraceae bacterium]
MARDDGYLVLSEEEAEELGDFFDAAIPHMEEPGKTDCAAWSCNLRGRGGVALERDATRQILDTLYGIAAENTARGPQMHIDARAWTSRIEHTLREARVPQQKRRVNLDGPGR